jgi:hypothetical protein
MIRIQPRPSTRKSEWWFSLKTNPVVLPLTPVRLYRDGLREREGGALKRLRVGFLVGNGKSPSSRSRLDT